MKRQNWAIIGTIIVLCAFLIPWKAAADKIGVLVNGTFYTDIGALLTGNTQISDQPYGATWDGNSTYAPSKNAVYDKVNTLVVSGGALGTPSSGTLTNCTFPTLNQNTTGTAAGLSGTPNITVGTVNAGAGGFLVDADGDVTAKSLTIARTDSPNYLKLYEATSDGNDSVSITVPAKGTGLAADATVTFSKSLAFTGTMTDGKYCTYTSTGTVIACNSTPMVEGTASGGLIFGDSSPDSTGEIGYNGDLQFYDAAALRTVATLDKAQTLSSKTIASPAIGITTTGLTASRAYYWKSDGTFALAKGDSATTMPALCVSNATTFCVTHGQIVLGAAVAGCTRGKAVYVSEASAGLLKCAAPATSTNQVQRVGIMNGTDEDNTTMYVMPSLDVITVP